MVTVVDQDHYSLLRLGSGRGDHASAFELFSAAIDAYAEQVRVAESRRIAGESDAAILAADAQRMGRSLAAVGAILKQRSYTDSLTGLWNHGAFIESFHELVDLLRTQDVPIAIILVDINNFKTYNDLFTEPGADEALVRLGTLWRPNEMYGFSHLFGEHSSRTGGDEFAILLRLDSVSAEEASDVLGNILQRLHHQGSEVLTAFIQEKVDAGELTWDDFREAVLKSFPHVTDFTPRLRIAGSVITPDMLMHRHVVVNGRSTRPGDGPRDMSTQSYYLTETDPDELIQTISTVVAQDVRFVKQQEKTYRL